MTELDRIYEAAVADDWEERNKETQDAPKLKKAAAKLRAAVVLLNGAIDRIENAVDCVRGIPAEDVVASYLTNLEDLRCDLNRMEDKYERGQTY